MIVGPPKTDAGVRDVAIPPHLLPLVKAHLKSHVGPDRGALLFPSAADGETHMAPSTLAELMGRIGRSTRGAAMRFQRTAADRDAEIARRLSELAGTSVPAERMAQ